MGLDPVSWGSLDSEVNKRNMRSMQQLRTKKKTSCACLLLQALKKEAYYKDKTPGCQ